MSDAILLERPAEGIARLVLNRPEKRNSLSAELREALVAAAETALADAEVRALIVTGAGGVFCAGGDISSMGKQDVHSGRARMRANHRLVRLLALAEKPIVAAVPGVAFGAGCGIALLADTIVGGQGASFGFNFFRLGLVPDYGLLGTLPARVGRARARRILLHGASVDIAEAERIGLVDLVVPDDQLDAAALAEAQALAAQPPHAFRLAKRVLVEAPTTLDALLDAELNAQTLCFVSPEHKEGVAAFQEKRRPKF
jgi:enoyl-CoA hydratase/carnithine racemase